jgi:sulfite reductase beta subunit-like hemoprotein
LNDLHWTKKRLGAFIELACLSEDEIDVLTDWSNRKDPTWSANHLSMSKSKVEKLRTQIRRRYDVVQKEYPEQFPLRIK